MPSRLLSLLVLLAMLPFLTGATIVIRGPRQPAAGAGGNGITSGLVAYWQFDEGSGSTVSDWTANNNDSIGSGGSPNWDASGKFGSALQFVRDDGDYYSIADSATVDLGATFTISCWIKWDSTAGDSQWILGKDVDTGDPDRAYAFGLYKPASNHLLTFQSAGSNHSGSSSLTSWAADGNWHHIAVVLSGGTLTFYIDGVSDGTASVSTPPNKSNVLRIGRRAYSGNEDGLNGRLDEIKIFSTALSSGDIAAEAAL